MLEHHLCLLSHAFCVKLKHFLIHWIPICWPAVYCWSASLRHNTVARLMFFFFFFPYSTIHRTKGRYSNPGCYSASTGRLLCIHQPSISLRFTLSAMVIMRKRSLNVQVQSRNENCRNHYQLSHFLPVFRWPKVQCVKYKGWKIPVLAMQSKTPFLSSV